ncbi:uncharacterized protein [Salminus brasiliensis]|uniref:uncharacterized protein n=1 Tax=Salminus brasiliensis TaxID=930266 RepID=UPI003B82FC9C
MKLILCVMVLFAVQWTAVLSVEPRTFCCRAISDKKVPVTTIEDYLHESSPPCRFNAVRFITKYGRSVCSDPESSWAKWVIKEVDSRKNTITAPTPAVKWTSTSLDVDLPFMPTPSRPSTTTFSKPSMAEIEPSDTCCQKTSEASINAAQIVHYIHQDLPRCPIKAVRFFTTSGNSICSDPESTWTEWAMLVVDSRERAHAPPEDTTSNMDPADHSSNPMMHKLPWTNRRWKKKTRSGLRKAQKKIYWTKLQGLSSQDHLNFILHITSDEEGWGVGDGWLCGLRDLPPTRTTMVRSCVYRAVYTTQRDKMRQLLLVVLLFTMQWMAVKLVDPSVSCCREISHNRVPVKNIENYLHEDSPPCRLKAVRFTTINGKSICSNPESSWAKWAIKEVDSRKPTTKPTKPTVTLTSTTLPTVIRTTTSTTTLSTPVTPKPTMSTMATTSSVPTENLPTSPTPYFTQSPSTTEEPPTTASPQRWTTTAGTTKGTSAKITAAVTYATSRPESAASTSAIPSTTRTTSTVKAARPPRTMQAPSGTTKPPVTVKVPVTHPRSSTFQTTRPQNPYLHKQPWTDRRWKKKRRSGLRKAQRKMHG